MIVIPKLPRPDSGLSQVGKTRWLIRWKKDGKPASKSIQAPTVEAARIARDHLYAKLRAAGAVVSGSPEHALSEDSRYIYRRKPYLVKVKGHTVGEFEAFGEAKDALRDYLEGGESWKS